VAIRKERKGEETSCILSETLPDGEKGGCDLRQNASMEEWGATRAEGKVSDRKVGKQVQRFQLGWSSKSSRFLARSNDQAHLLGGGEGET